MSDITANGVCPACRRESLVLRSDTGNVRCKYEKNEHAPPNDHQCPDPEQITRIIDMARWIDESGASDVDVYRAEFALPDEWSVAQVKNFGGQLEAFDTVMHHVNLADNKITVQVHPPHRLSHDYIPAGTHEFARGWGMRHVMGELSRVLGEKIVWQQLRVSTHAPWRPLRESKETVTV